MVHCSHLITHLGWCSRPSHCHYCYWPILLFCIFLFACGYNDHGLTLHKLKFICSWFWHTCDRYLWLRWWWFKHLCLRLDSSLKLSLTHLHHPSTCSWSNHLSASKYKYFTFYCWYITYDWLMVLSFKYLANIFHVMMI